MNMEPNISKDLSERQCAVIAHYVKVLNADVDRMRYLHCEKKIFEAFPVDIAIFEPNDTCDFYTIATVGLSSYRFNDSARGELVLSVPKTWKPNVEREEYYWVPEFLQDIALQLVWSKIPLSFGQVFEYEKGDMPGYSPFTDAAGGIIVFPEDYPLDMIEEEIENSFTRFFQLVILNQDDIDKVDEQGVKEFVKFELHDSEGPQFKVKFVEPKPDGIEKIIEHNEKILMDKNKKRD